MEQYVQISFQQTLPEQREILVALLANIGFTGFEENGKELVACIPLSDFNESVFKETVSDQLPYAVKIIEQKNWNEEWERSFPPVVVDDYCAIRASFHPPVSSVAHEIIITPKMSFGTGHHATTYLMIRLMKDIRFTNCAVLDFGTGTGVLAILAEKLGASSITAIDNDNWSIDNAKENIGANRCRRIQVMERSAPPPDETYDIILANINKNVILAEMAAMEQHLEENGVLLISGLLEEDKKEIADKASTVHLTIVHTGQKDNWIALVLKRKMI
ncbi:MAG TPA: 50S ribosomal protein L11 methyltransferase [Flavitalea sp.]|nr:50S ribosomal protein L11 methyltransferase [Flavitalea sp.]